MTVDEDNSFFTDYERLRFCNVHDGVIEYDDLPEYLKDKLLIYFNLRSDIDQRITMSHTVHTKEWLKQHLYLLL